MTWAVTEQGKDIPLDPEPRKDGNFFLRPRRDGKLTAVAVTLLDQPSQPHQLYVAHFVTCPHADQHRRSS